MTNDLKPYPAMKDSGVPWLGDVPEHWRFERAKWLFRKMDRPIREDDQVVTCFRNGVVTLAPDAQVTYDDHIPGRQSGKKRQIDVSIRSRVGASESLVIVQCRDHKKLLAASAYNYALGLLQEKALSGESRGLISGMGSNPTLMSKLGQVKDAASSIALTSSRSR